MKNTIVIKIIGILVIAALVWWGVWGHTMTSNASDYWFHEDDRQCAPAYPVVGFLIIVAFWGSIICVQGGIKWYGSELSKWITIGLGIFIMFSITAIALFR